MNQKKRFNMALLTSVFIATLLLTLAAAVFGQTPTPTPVEPFVTELRGVSIGMTRDEVKDKLGKPKVSDKAGMYFELAKNESAQIGIDAKGLVRTVALIYANGDSDAPKFEDIFGPDVAMVKKKDGSVYKLVRYRSAGFWIAYSRSAGKKAMTTVTMRRIGQ